MAAYKIWSDERKGYIQSLLPNKRILFANVNGAPKAYWQETTDEYDVIIGYCRSYDYYDSMNYDLHRSCKSVTLNCISDYLSEKKICVGIRTRSLERVIYIPSRKIEDFCRYFSYYMERYSN